jgi:hypothetical protein
LLLHLPPPGCPVRLPHLIALDGENGDANRGQRDGDDCEEGIAAHANVRPFSGPTDFLSLSDAACDQVKARSISIFLASSVLDWRDHSIASSAYSRNCSAFVMERRPTRWRSLSKTAHPQAGRALGRLSKFAPNLERFSRPRVGLTTYRTAPTENNQCCPGLL